MNPAFQLSEETAKLVRFLKAFNKGDQVTYSELSTAAGVVINSRSAKLISARRLLEQHDNQVWVCVQPCIAVRRLTDAEIAARLPNWWLRGARSKLKRGGEQSEVVEMQELDIDQQARFAVDCIQRELAFNSLSKMTRNRMERVARGNSNDLPAFTAVEWAISLSPRRKPQPKAPNE
jgi:hypothetical protein